MNPLMLLEMRQLLEGFVAIAALILSDSRVDQAMLVQLLLAPESFQACRTDECFFPVSCSGRLGGVILGLLRLFLVAWSRNGIGHFFPVGGH